MAPELFDTLLPVDSPIKRGDKTLLHGRKSILREPVQMEQCEEPNEVHGMLPGDLLREKFLQEQEESSMQEFGIFNF